MKKPLSEIFNPTNALFLFKDVERYNLFRKHYDSFLMQLLANLVRLASFSSAYVKEEAIFHMIERVKETIFHVAPEMLDQMLALGYGKVLLTPEF